MPAMCWSAEAHGWAMVTSRATFTFRKQSKAHGLSGSMTLTTCRSKILRERISSTLTIGVRRERRYTRMLNIMAGVGGDKIRTK